MLEAGAFAVSRPFLGADFPCYSFSDDVRANFSSRSFPLSLPERVKGPQRGPRPSLWPNEPAPDPGFEFPVSDNGVKNGYVLC